MRQNVKIIPGIASLCLSLTVYWLTSGFPANTRVAAFAMTLLVCCWGFRLVTEGTSALLFFFILIVGKVVPLRYIFSGFTTSPFWLIFSGLIIAQVLRESGLTKRLAHVFRPGAKATYSGMLARVIFAGLIFSLLIPSAVSRVLIMLPLLMGIASVCGFTPEDKGYKGIVLGGSLGTHLPGFGTLSANMANVIYTGAIHTQYGLDIGYLKYFLLNFPVLGLGKALLLWFVLLLLFNDRLKNMGAVEVLPPWDRRERNTLLVMVVALCFWMTDSLHGISPGWIGLGAVLVFLAPIPGWYSEKLLEGVQMGMLLFVACAIGVGGVISQSGLADCLQQSLLSHLPFTAGASPWNVVTSLGLFTFGGMATSIPGIPSIFVPLAGQLAAAASMPLISMLALIVPAYSTILLPYQSPAFLISATTSGLPYSSVVVFCLVMALLTFVVIFPLQVFWLHLLGYSFAAV